MTRHYRHHCIGEHKPSLTDYPKLGNRWTCPTCGQVWERIEHDRTDDAGKTRRMVWTTPPSQLGASVEWLTEIRKEGEVFLRETPVMEESIVAKVDRRIEDGKRALTDAVTELMMDEPEA